MCFEKSGDHGHYRAEDKWFRQMSGLKKGFRRLREGEGASTRERTLRMSLNRGEQTISYYVDDQLLGVMQYEGGMDTLTKVGVGLKTPYPGDRFDIRFENLRVRLAKTPELELKRGSTP